VAREGTPANGDVRLNGRLTLGENTADSGGLRVAYAALQKALAGKPRATIDGFTPEQRFFLGFANVVVPERHRGRGPAARQTDSHSPGEFRVKGKASATMPEFDRLSVRGRSAARRASPWSGERPAGPGESGDDRHPLA